MSIKRLSRILICLVLVFSLLVGISPVSVYASSVTGDSVLVDGLYAVAAMLVALGIMPGDSVDDFNSLVDGVAERLATKGLLVNGLFSVLKLVTEGKVSYYARQDALEEVRSFLVESTVVSAAAVQPVASWNGYTAEFNFKPLYYYLVNDGYIQMIQVIVSTTAGSIYKNGYAYDYESYNNGFYVYYLGYATVTSIDEKKSFSQFGAYNGVYNVSFSPQFASSYEKIAPLIPSYEVVISPLYKGGFVPSISKSISEGYSLWASNGLSQSNDDGEEEIYLPLGIAGTYADTIVQSQSQVQTGESTYTDEVVPEVNTGAISQTWLGQKIDAITDWLSDVKEAVVSIPGAFANWFSDVLAGIQSLGDIITNACDNVVQALLTGIQSIFVPSEDFLTAKVDALRSEFSFADSIITSGEYIGNSLQGLGTEPPVIYINLANNRGPYDLGGEVAFLDLRWYEEYKPVGDAIISAFLWLLFVWRLYVKAPGIIRGLPGDVQTVKDFRDNGGK